MAVQDFNFEEFKAKKFNTYVKEDCKPNFVKKAKGGILFIDYKMNKKKQDLVFIAFKKYSDAAILFKTIKQNKEHIPKKRALVTVEVAKGADGKDQITLEIKKGGMAPDDIVLKGDELFGKKLKMKMNIIGSEQAVAVAEASVSSAVSETTEAPEEEVSTGITPQIQTALDQIIDKTNKLGEVAGQLPPDKLQANVDKLKSALNKVLAKTTNDAERTAVETLVAELDELQESAAQGGGKKLTPERLAKIQENLPKIKDILTEIGNELGIDVSALA